MKQWESALIGYVVWEAPYEKQMENFVTRVWNFVAKPLILWHDEGYYIFKFQIVKDKKIVLQDGPYYYNNMPIILK